MKKLRLSLQSAVGVIAGFSVLAAFAAVGTLYALTDVPSPKSFRAKWTPSEGRLLDRDGRLLHETRLNPTLRRLGWVELRDVPEVLRQAVILSEDRRFASHSGVDWLALGKAGYENLRGVSRRGASTLTMQLVPKRAGRRGWTEKITQVIYAWKLERTWTKDQILEGYLNTVSFRGELQGLRAASHGLFGKAPHALGKREALILAVLIRSPQAITSQVLRRACALGRQTGELKDCDELGTELPALAIERSVSLAPHLAQKLLNGKNREVTTTLDAGLQAEVLETLRRHVLAIESQNARDAAALVVENYTGEVLGYVGSLGASGSAPHVDSVRAYRQAGSTLKPFLYATAIEERYLTAETRLEDTPTEIQLGPGIYRPRNYDHRFQGWVKVREALGSSLNVPAVKALQLIGVERMVQTLRNLGFTGLKDADHYGPSLALGSADITLWDLVNGYRALANGGVASTLLLQPGETRLPGMQVFTPPAAFIVSDILANRENRHLSFGLESTLSTRFWTAVKTGTSKDMRDNWCVGYSSRYTVGVWVGNASGESMWNLSGVDGAAPAWAEIMGYLHRELPSSPPAVPPGVVTLQEKGRRSHFLSGTEPNEEGLVVQQAAALKSVRIKVPLAGEIYAYDPDIPVARQRIFFESERKSKAHRFRLNGEWLGTAAERIFWSPRRGKHELSLVSEKDEVLHSVEFEVR